MRAIPKAIAAISIREGPNTNKAKTETIKPMIGGKLFLVFLTCSIKSTINKLVRAKSTPSKENGMSWPATAPMRLPSIQ